MVQNVLYLAVPCGSVFPEYEDICVYMVPVGAYSDITFCLYLFNILSEVLR